MVRCLMAVMSPKSYVVKNRFKYHYNFRNYFIAKHGVKVVGTMFRVERDIKEIDYSLEIAKKRNKQTITASYVFD